MKSENHRLRCQIADLQYENTYMHKFTEMQAEIISLKQQVIDLKDDLTDLYLYLVNKVRS